MAFKTEIYDMIWYDMKLAFPCLKKYHIYSIAKIVSWSHRLHRTISFLARKWTSIAQLYRKSPLLIICYPWLSIIFCKVMSKWIQIERTFLAEFEKNIPSKVFACVCNYWTHGTRYFVYNARFNIRLSRLLLPIWVT